VKKLIVSFLSLSLVAGMLASMTGCPSETKKTTTTTTEKKDSGTTKTEEKKEEKK
jgi:hypothetical protein